MLATLGNRMLPHIDGPAGPEKPSQSALCQLLLKSVSKDKKFVLEAAQRVLSACTDTLDAHNLTLKLLPYAKHKCASPAPSANAQRCDSVCFSPADRSDPVGFALFYQPAVSNTC